MKCPACHAQIGFFRNAYFFSQILQRHSDAYEKRQALAKREKPTVVSGVKNKMVTNLTRMLPRRGIVKMMATFG